jgi:hypothetical protein
LTPCRLGQEEYQCKGGDPFYHKSKNIRQFIKTLSP